MVECEASTFPLVNLTKVSTAVHSIQYFILSLLHGHRATFWHPSLFNTEYLVAPTGVPASLASTAGGGDSPSYSGFFHCLAVFDDQRSPYFGPDGLLQCTRSFPQVFYPVWLGFIPCSLFSPTLHS